MEKRILLLSNNDNVQTLYDWLKQQAGYSVKLYHNPVTLKMVTEYLPDLVISYNYQYIINEDVINFMGDEIINMHISMLPWNRGASPNIWSFIDDTPKGVTIHRLEKKLDAGKIIFQKRVAFDEDTETLSSTYQKLNSEIIKLLIENWKRLEAGDFYLTEQKGKGSYHRVSDLEKLLNGTEIDYNMKITDFKKYISELGH